MLRRQLVPVLTFVIGAGLVFGGCGSSSNGTATGGSGGSTGGAGGTTTGGSGGGTGGAGGTTTGGSGGGSGGATGGSGGATGGSGGATGGAGGSGPNLGCGTAANTCTKADTDAQSACLISKCATAYQPCLGSGFLTGTFGGSCGTWFKCVNDCGCNYGCIGNCATPSTECQSCLQTASQCQMSMCPQPACYGMKPDAGTTNPGVDGGTGGGCTELKACCDMIAESNTKAACNAQASNGDPTACGAVLATFRSGHLCN